MCVCVFFLFFLFVSESAVKMVFTFFVCLFACSGGTGAPFKLACAELLTCRTVVEITQAPVCAY